MNSLCMPGEGVQELASVRIPDPYGMIITPSGDTSTIRGPTHAIDQIDRLVSEHMLGLSNVRVPDLGGIIITAGGNEPAIRGPSNTINAALVAHERMEEAASLGIPRPSGIVTIGVAPGNDAFTIRGPGDASQRRSMPNERV